MLRTLVPSVMLVPALIMALFLAGCSNYSGNSFSGDQVRSAQTVRRGVVVSVRSAELGENTSGIIGAAGGGVAGGVLGHMIGGGTGKTLATLGGVALGAAGGYAAEKAITKQKGIEITVKLDDGAEVSVVQAADQMFSEGESVRVLYGRDGSARVSR